MKPYSLNSISLNGSDATQKRQSYIHDRQYEKYT